MEAAEREEPETQESTEHAEEQDSPPSDPGAKAASEQPYDAGEVLGDGGADLAPGAVRVSEQTIVAVQLGELGRLTAQQAQQARDPPSLLHPNCALLTTRAAGAGGAHSR